MATKTVKVDIEMGELIDLDCALGDYALIGDEDSEEKMKNCTDEACLYKPNPKIPGCPIYYKYRKTEENKRFPIPNLGLFY